MNHKKFLLIIFIIFSVNSCADTQKEVDIIKETNQDLEMLTAYKEAYEALEQNDPYFAAKRFLEAELLFPQSIWAPRSALMASYSYYMQNYYAEALLNLERYLKTSLLKIKKPPLIQIFLLIFFSLKILIKFFLIFNSPKVETGFTAVTVAVFLFL